MEQLSRAFWCTFWKDPRSGALLGHYSGALFGEATFWRTFGGGSTFWCTFGRFFPFFPAPGKKSRTFGRFVRSCFACFFAKEQK